MAKKKVARKKAIKRFACNPEQEETAAPKLGIEPPQAPPTGIGRCFQCKWWRKLPSNHPLQESDMQGKDWGNCHVNPAAVSERSMHWCSNFGWNESTLYP